MSTKILKLPEVQSRTKLGRSTIYGMMGRGEFPKPIKIGRSVGWPSTEIDSWIDDLAKGPRDHQKA